MGTKGSVRGTHTAVVRLCLVVGLSAVVRTTAMPAALGFPPGEPFSEPTWEISVPEAEGIADQGKFPYCGLYAMATYLELWAKGGRPSYAYAAMDPTYLAVGYNRIVGNGTRGTHPLWLAATTQYYGAIPREAAFTGTAAWPPQNWEKAHETLMNTGWADAVLTGTYRHPKVTTEFSGASFLKYITKIDFSRIVGLHTTYREATKESTPKTAPAQYRGGTYWNALRTVQTLSARVNVPVQYAAKTPAQLYSHVHKQLYARRPVYLTINVGLTQKKFSQYRLITGQDLVAVGAGNNWLHAVVAVAHCDKHDTQDAICRRFGRLLERGDTRECIAIQNSWGVEAHEQGYACLTPEAFHRIGLTALVDRAVLH